MTNYDKTYLFHPDVRGHHLILLVLIYFQVKCDVRAQESERRGLFMVSIFILIVFFIIMIDVQ